MTSLLQCCEILTSLLADLCTIVSHPLSHLLQLHIIGIHSSLASLVGVPNLRETAFEYGFRFLHLALAFRLLARDARGLFFLQLVNLLAQSYRLVVRRSQALVQRAAKVRHVVAQLAQHAHLQTHLLQHHGQGISVNCYLL